MRFYLKFLLSLLFVLTVNPDLSLAQVHLQLERFNNPKSLKFYAGQTLEFKLKEYPDSWKKFEILDMKAEENILVLEDRFYKLDEFSEIRIRHPFVKSFGKRLVQFSGVWFAYGGIASVASENYTIGGAEIITGLSAGLAGLLMNKLFDKRKLKLSNKKRLRIVDTRFSTTDF